MGAETDVLMPGALGKRAAMLRQAFDRAASGQTVLYVAPSIDGVREYLNYIAHHVIEQDKHWHARVDYTNREVRFEGTRGSIRFYTPDHAEWDSRVKVMRGYPAGVPTFTDPELE